MDARIFYPNPYPHAPPPFEYDSSLTNKYVKILQTALGNCASLTFHASLHSLHNRHSVSHAVEFREFEYLCHCGRTTRSSRWFFFPYQQKNFLCVFSEFLSNSRVCQSKNHQRQNGSKETSRNVASNAGARSRTTDTSRGATQSGKTAHHVLILSVRSNFIRDVDAIRFSQWNFVIRFHYIFFVWMAISVASNHNFRMDMDEFL